MKLINLQIVKENMHMTMELIEVTKLLDLNKIENISFKGPSLAYQAYENISLRQYSDLDILIKPKDLEKLKLLIEKKTSYTNTLHLNKEQELLRLKYAHEISYITGNNVKIEFHLNMLDLDHPINLNYFNFFSNKKRFKLINQDLNILKNEYFLIYLCIHGSKHFYERIEWVVDIDKFIRTQDIDWQLMNILVKKRNFERFVILGLELSRKLFNTPIEHKMIKLDNNINSSIDHIFRMWNKNLKFNNKSNFKSMLKLFINLKDKIKYTHKVFFKPTFSEYWYVAFPKPLYFLYYPLRQYLLFKKYFFKK